MGLYSTASPNVIDRSTEVPHTCLRTGTRFVDHTDISTIVRKFGHTGHGRGRSFPGLRCKSVSALRPDLPPHKSPRGSVLPYRCSLIPESHLKRSEAETGFAAGCGHVGTGGPRVLLRLHPVPLAHTRDLISQPCVRLKATGSKGFGVSLVADKTWRLLSAVSLALHPHSSYPRYHHVQTTRSSPHIADQQNSRGLFISAVLRKWSSCIHQETPRLSHSLPCGCPLSPLTTRPNSCNALE